MGHPFGQSDVRKSVSGFRVNIATKQNLEHGLSEAKIVMLQRNNNPPQLTLNLRMTINGSMRAIRIKLARLAGQSFPIFAAATLVPKTPGRRGSSL